MELLQRRHPMFSAESEFANGGEFTVATGTSDGQSALMRGQGVLYSRTGKYGNADDKLRLVASADKPGFNVRVALIFFLSTYALTGGVLALVGWATNRPRLTDWIGHGISIFPNTAIACICLGLAVLVRLNRATWSVVAA